MQKEDCLFCGIASGNIESAKIYEDDKVFAFKDIAPMMPVHVLIVPKDHYDNIADSIPDDTLVAMMRAVEKVADIAGIRESGFRVVMNTNDDACQTVHHVHVHVLGGAQMNDGNPSVS